jgi:hypothetical protein
MGVTPDPALMKPVPEATGIKEAVVPTAAPELRWANRGRLIAPDLSGLSMRDALVTLEGAGLSVRIEGSGRVTQQSPSPGRTLRPGDRMEVILK